MPDENVATLNGRESDRRPVTHDAGGSPRSDSGAQPELYAEVNVAGKGYRKAASNDDVYSVTMVDNSVYE